MAVRIRTYSWGEPRRRGEGLRISCTRYLPRGVNKQDYARRDLLDVWLPTLAPSRKLVAQFRGAPDRPGAWERFLSAYKKEMRTTDARQVIRTLARLAESTPISLGCSCAGPHCHRFELERLVRAAAAGQF